jgi:hypothetical protein
MTQPYPDGTSVTGLVGSSSINGKIVGHHKYIVRTFQGDGIHLVSERVKYTYTVQSDEEHIPYPRSIAEKSGTYECEVVLLREKL